MQLKNFSSPRQKTSLHQPASLTNIYDRITQQRQENEHLVKNNQSLRDSAQQLSQLIDERVALSKKLDNEVGLQLDVLDQLNKEYWDKSDYLVEFRSATNRLCAEHNIWVSEKEKYINDIINTIDNKKEELSAINQKTAEEKLNLQNLLDLQNQQRQNFQMEIDQFNYEINNLCNIKKSLE